MEEYQEFLKEIKKVKSKRVHKISGSLGIKDAYNHYRRNRPKEKKFVVKESDYFAIIRRLNEVIADQLSKGYEIKLPYRTGSLLVEKFKISPKINEEGKLVFKAPIDWDATLKLWFESPIDKENKTLVKTEKREIFKVVYCKKNANYINSSFVMFSPTRSLKNKIKEELKEGYIQKPH
jgi:hypothetical protein